MQVGVFTFLTDETIGPVELARAVEERGFESLFLPEHTHIPTSRLTARFDGDLPGEYSRTLDPFIALTAAAVATTNLLLGTGACLVIERDPIVTAKEVATLDRISGGRFCSAWQVGGTVRRCATTAPIRRPAGTCSRSGSRR